MVASPKFLKEKERGMNNTAMIIMSINTELRKKTHTLTHMWVCEI